MPNFWDLVKLTGEFIAGNLKGPTPGGVMNRLQLQALLTVDSPQSRYFGAEVHVTSPGHEWIGVMCLHKTDWDWHECALGGPDGVCGSDGKAWRSPTDDVQPIPSIFEHLVVVIYGTDDVARFTVDEKGAIVLPETGIHTHEIHGPISISLRILPRGHPECIGLHTKGRRL